MPELPEVETIKKGLEEYVIGDVITEVEIHLPKIFSGKKSEIIGAEITRIRRLGKAIILELSNGLSLIIHVKMTGQLIYILGNNAAEKSLKNQPISDFLPNKHTHVIFHLKSQNADGNTKKAVLYFNDIRKFGWIKIVKTENLKEISFFKNLGKEPLRDLTLADFKILLKKSKAPVKQVLMDQQKIAGIGNIYANDALWEAQIHPLRMANSLTKKESAALFTSIEKVLILGIETGGASERNYVNVLGGKGSYQNYFLVYKKTGKPCKRCGEIIERIVVGGRGTFICQKCQR